MSRKPKKYHYIYKTTCKITGKFYVGMHSSDSLDDGYLGSGKILGYSRKKYGDENHVREILEMCSSRNELKQREKEIVNEALLADPLNINLKYGGDGGWDHVNGDVDLKFQASSKAGKVGGKSFIQKHGQWWRSSEIRSRAVETRRKNPLGYNAGLIGKKGFSLSLEHKRKISVAASAAQSGSGNSQFGVKRVGISKDGKIKKVLPSQLQEFLDCGWKKGFK